MAHTFERDEVTGQATAASPASSGPAQFEEIPPTQPVVREQLVNLHPAASFYYWWHEARWTCMDGEWLPQLGIMRLDPGVDGVAEGGSKKIAEMDAKAKGRTLIPHDAIKLTMPDRTSYVRAFKVRAGENRTGKHHMSVWETPKQIGAKVIIKSDTDGYRDWLRALVREGYIPPPDPDIVDALLDSQRQRLEAAAGSNNPKRAERAQARLEEMENAAQPGKKKKKPGRPKGSKSKGKD